VSKHHYAIELAKRGNTVYFLNPIRDNRSLFINILAHEKIKGLFLVSYSSLIPYWIKFHFREVFDFFLRIQIQRLLATIGNKVDIVWDFDCGNMFTSYDQFKAELNIFHPVDQANTPLPLTKKPEFIFSVSQEILNSYRNSSAPKYFVNHGIGGAFLELARKKLKDTRFNVIANKPLIGAYIGNLMVQAINHSAILDVIYIHPEIEFHFYGPFSTKTEEKHHPESITFVKRLLSCSNVILHGAVNQGDLAHLVADVDFFFFNYKRTLRYNSDNSHKILEYLSSGKVIIGSSLSAYAGSNLFLQAENEQKWIKQFENLDVKLQNLNSSAAQIRRLEFVLQNSYDKQINRIMEIVKSKKRT